MKHIFSRFSFVLGCLALLSATTSQARAAEGLVIPQFLEETSSAGVDSIYRGDWQYMVGGGAAAFDCNGDGYPDLALAGGEGKASFFVNKSAQAERLQFSRFDSGAELERVTGFYPLDIDGDGVMDLVVLRVGEITLLRGLGACKFERANEQWRFKAPEAWWTSFSATWERGAAWPTLAFGAYIDPKSENNPWGSCTDNVLVRPIPETKGFADAIPLKPSYCALSMLFTDWNRSGTPSLRVSNDREYYEGGQEQLWHVNAGEPPRLYTDAEGWKFLKIWGMGIASTVLSGEQHPSYFLTSMSDNKLQVLRSPPDGPLKPMYKDIAYDRGAVAYRPYTGGDLRPSTAWHAQFEDANNDGFADLFIAKGNVDRMPDFAEKDPNNLLLQKADASFTEVGDVAGVASFANARGGILADFNLDGLIDLVVVNRRETAKVWRNVTPDAGRWIEILLADLSSNRDAIGAWVEVRQGEQIQTREITSGGGHASGQNGWWHFGTGASQSVDVRITWPDGRVGEWQTATTNAFYVMSPNDAPRAWTPAIRAQ